MDIAIVKAKLAHEHRTKSTTRNLLDDAIEAEKEANASFDSKPRGHEAKQLRKKLDKEAWMPNFLTADTLNRRGIKKKGIVQDE